MTMKKLLAAGTLSTILLLGACGENDETDITEPDDPNSDVEEVEQEDRGEDIEEEEGEDDSSTE